MDTKKEGTLSHAPSLLEPIRAQGGYGFRDDFIFRLKKPSTARKFL